MKDLQNKMLFVGATDAQQVGSVFLAEQVSLQPAEPLFLLGQMKHLHAGGKDVITVQLPILYLCKISRISSSIISTLNNYHSYL